MFSARSNQITSLQNGRPTLSAAHLARHKRWAKVESRFDPYAIQSGCCLGLSRQHHWWQVKPRRPPPHTYTSPTPAAHDLSVHLSILRSDLIALSTSHCISCLTLAPRSLKRILEKPNLFFFPESHFKSFRLLAYLLKVFDSLLLFLSLIPSLNFCSAHKLFFLLSSN